MEITININEILMVLTVFSFGMAVVHALILGPLLAKSDAEKRLMNELIGALLLCFIISGILWFLFSLSDILSI